MEYKIRLPILTGKSSSLLLRRHAMFGMVKAAVAMLGANWRVMASLSLLAMIPCSILLEAERFAMLPLVQELNSHMALYNVTDTLSKPYVIDEIKHDSQLILGLEAFFCIIILILALFYIAAVAVASIMSHSKEKFSLWDLLLGVKQAWKNPFPTFFYIFVLQVAYTLALLLLIMVGMLLNGLASTVFYSMMYILGFLVFVYLPAVWMLALVVSFTEADTSGIKAIWRAQKLIRGRRIQGFLLMLLVLVAGACILLVFGSNIVALRKFSVKQSGLRCLEILLILLVKLFAFMVFSVFYYECKKSEEEKLEAKTGFVYTSVPYGGF